MVYDLFFIQAFCTLPHLHIKMKPGSLDVTESGPMRFLKVVGGWLSLKEVPPTQHLCGPTSLLWHLPLLSFLLCLQPQLLHMPLRSLTKVFPSTCEVLKLMLTECHLGLATGIWRLMKWSCLHTVTDPQRCMSVTMGPVSGHLLLIGMWFCWLGDGVFLYF